MVNKDAKIFVAGHQGLVGSAICRALTTADYTNLVTRTKEDLDLTDKAAVAEFFSTEKPEYVYLAAAKVGGIMANRKSPADFIRINLEIQNNVIDAAYQNQVTKLLFLGSSCIYPHDCAQPMKEEYLLTGKPEPTNEFYAIAKIAGLKMCQAYNQQYGTNFISVMPTNIYGPGDNFDLESSHVIPAFIRRFHEAKINGSTSVRMWGTGSARREFLYVDDLATLCLQLMSTYDSSDIINIGTGTDLTIKELAETIADIVGYEGSITWDDSKPDGMPRKLLDVSKLQAMGYGHTTNLSTGLQKTFEWFQTHNL